MNELIELRDFYESSVLGDYDKFLCFAKSKKMVDSKHDFLELCFMWNCVYASEFIVKSSVLGGLEICSGKRVFILAPNPKLTRTCLPWRITNFIKDIGAICEDEFSTVEEAIIHVLINYPDAFISEGILDKWF